MLGGRNSVIGKTRFRTSKRLSLLSPPAFALVVICTTPSWTVHASCSLRLTISSNMLASVIGAARFISSTRLSSSITDCPSGVMMMGMLVTVLSRLITSE